MKTEVMRARFIGKDQSKGLGLINGGTYWLRLMHPNWLQKLLGEVGVIAVVSVSGFKKYISYESIQAFDNNWILKEKI